MNGARPGSGSTSESFADLVSFNGAKSRRLQKMSLLDRQKAAEEDEKKKRLEEQKRVTGVYGMDASAWDALEILKSPQGRPNSVGFSEDARVDSVGSHLSAFEASAPVNHKTRFPQTELLEDDDPFDLKFVPQVKTPPTINTNDEDGDDFLGELGKPISTVPKDNMETNSVKKSTDLQGSRGISPLGRKNVRTREDPRDSAIASMVDMGFSDSDARRSLANTDTGLDIHAAISNVLSEAHRETRPSSVPAARKAPENHPDENYGHTTPATDIRQSFIKNANTLWSQGRKKVAQAIEDFGRDEDPSIPRWMRTDRSEHKTNSDTFGITEEARALEINEIHIQRPVTTGSTRPLRRGDVAEEAYMSPARRRHQPGPFESASLPPRPRSTLNPGSTTVEKPPRNSPISRNMESGTQSPLLSIKQDTSTIKKEPILSRPSSKFSQESLSLQRVHRLNAQRKTGSEAFTRGDYSAAVNAYTTAISQLPRNHVQHVVFWCNRALCLMKMGDPKAAIADCDAVLHLIGPDDSYSIQIDGQNKKLRDYWAKAITRRAEGLEQIERYADAYEAWDKAAKAGIGGLAAAEGKRRMANVHPGNAARSAPKVRPISTPSRKIITSSNANVGPGEAVRQLRVAEKKAQAEDDQRFAFHDTVAARTLAWKGGKENNLRALLGSLDTVLWSEVGWEKVSLADLVLAKRVKVIYMRAIAKLHPDKISANASIEQRMIASAVFTALNEAWDAFKQELS